MDQPVPIILISQFNKFIDESFLKCSNTNVKIFSAALDKFPEIKPHLNNTLYDWYFGTFLNKILTMVFQPYLYDPDSGIPIRERYDSKSCPNIMRLSDMQIRDALWTVYYLIINNYCDPTIKDYYDLTPAEYVSTANKSLIILDQDILDYIPQFSFILRRGKSLVTLQQSFIKKWHTEYIRKRREAVAVFERHWLEVIMNPNTTPGKRKFKQLQSHFYQLAEST